MFHPGYEDFPSSKTITALVVGLVQCAVLPKQFPLRIKEKPVDLVFITHVVYSVVAARTFVLKMELPFLISLNWLRMIRRRQMSPLSSN
jgi:hypothetical protein